jgi:hypothetical protein
MCRALDCRGFTAIVLKFAEASTAGGVEAIAFLQWGQRIDGPVTSQTFPTGFAYSRSRKEAADRAAKPRLRVAQTPFCGGFVIVEGVK